MYALNSIVEYLLWLLYITVLILVIWCFLICIEYLLNKYYGYRRYNFSKTYYIKSNHSLNSDERI